MDDQSDGVATSIVEVTADREPGGAMELDHLSEKAGVKGETTADTHITLT